MNYDELLWAWPNYPSEYGANYAIANYLINEHIRTSELDYQPPEYIIFYNN